MWDFEGHVRSSIQGRGQARAQTSQEECREALRGLMVGNAEDDRPPFQLRSFRPEDLTRYKASGAEEATLTGDLEKMYSITALPGPSLSKPGRAATGLRDGRRNCSLQSGDRAQAFTSLPGGHRSSLAAHVRGGHWRCGHWRGRSQAHGALGPGAWLRDPNGMGPAWGAAGLQTAGELPADPSGRSDSGRAVHDAGWECGQWESGFTRDESRQKTKGAVFTRRTGGKLHLITSRSRTAVRRCPRCWRWARTRDSASSCSDRVVGTQENGTS